MSIIYIAESKEFIVNGKVIKESTLTETERKELKSKATKQSILTNESKSLDGTILI